jgi:hypothetical protein
MAAPDVASSQGGGILNNYYSSLTVENSSITANSASQGGGIYNFGTLTVQNDSVAGNTASAGGGIFDYYYAIAVGALDARTFGNVSPRLSAAR